MALNNQEWLIFHETKQNQVKPKLSYCSFAHFEIRVETIRTTSFLRSVKLKENGKRDKYQDPAREPKKSVEYESDGDISCNGCARYSH